MMHNEIFITNKKINDIKIALLSDIHYHYGYSEKRFNKVIKELENNKPNYICIVGDILDSSNCIKLGPLLHFLKVISNIAPLIVTLGNHDIKMGEIKHWQHKQNNIFIKELKKIPNLYLLEDQIFKDKENNITFYGFNLSYNYYEIQDENYEVFKDEVNKLEGKFPSNTYNITLIHSPINIYKYIENNPKHNLSKSDLILSGHMHNGCLPFTISHFINKTFKSTRGIITPIRKLLSKHTQGRVTGIKDGYIYEGLITFSKSTKFFQIFNIFYNKKVEFITIKKVSK